MIKWGGIGLPFSCLQGAYIPNKAIDGNSATFFAGDHDVGVLTEVLTGPQGFGCR